MKQLGNLVTLLLAMTGTTVTAAAIPAKKLTITRTNRDCGGHSDTLLTDSFGFVNLNKPASGKLVAAIVVQGATPSATYKVRLLQVPKLPPCYDNVPSTTLVTDSSGDGNTNFQQPVDPAATAAFVDLNNLADPNNDYFTTNPDDFKITPSA